VIEEPTTLIEPDPAVAEARMPPSIPARAEQSRQSTAVTTHVVNAPQQPTPTPRTTTVPVPIVESEDVFDEPGETMLQTPQGSALGGGIQPGGSRTLTTGQRVFTGEPLDLTLKDADIKDVLRTFAQLTGLNIAIDPAVAGTVTVEFNGVPWDQALDLILRQNGLAYDIEGNVMRIGTAARLSQEAADARRREEETRLAIPTTTVARRLSYARAADLLTVLQSLASARGKIITDARTNQLIVTDIPDALRTMLNLIDTLDIPTPQVVIEARIVETTKTFSRQFGVSLGADFDLDPTLGTGTGLQFPNRIGGTIGGPGSVFDLALGSTVFDITLGNVLGTFDLDVILAAAESEGLARVISAPRVATQDNTPAEIQSGIQIPFQTRVNFTTTVAFVDATLRLSVTPQITAENTVIMQVEVQKVEPAEALATAGAENIPLITRRAQTRLMVRDGGTAVIGGIYQSTDNTGEDRVPILHQIPVLGNLFKNKTVSQRHDELLIFITPRIVRTIGSSS
jgi:type IV pilus assembly protein PilQ